MVWIITGVALVGLALLAWRMFVALAAQRGNREGDAADAALRTLSQMDAFRVSRGDREPWDGVEHFPGSQGSETGGLG